MRAHRHANSNRAERSTANRHRALTSSTLRPSRIWLVAATAVALLAAACSSEDDDGSTAPATEAAPRVTTSVASETDTSTDGTQAPAATTEPPAPTTATTTTAPINPTVKLISHESFNISESTLQAFTAQTGYEVELLEVGDTGELVAQAVLTAGNPLGDAIFGVDNTFLQRALNADIFSPYRSPLLSGVPDEFQLDSGNWRVTPVDYGDVCINWHKDGLDNPPTSLSDLTDPRFEGELVVQHPETSSPGLAFMLATIAHFGDDWQQFWADLRANDVAVTTGWTDAYFGEFVAGGGPRNLVVSYASSPPAEVLFADPPVTEPPTGVLTDGCFRQIEFAGVLAGAANPAGAQALIDFMLSETWQADVPLNMFVYPTVSGIELPEVFAEHTPVIDNPLTLSPTEIEANRDAWTEAWVNVVLR